MNLEQMLDGDLPDMVPYHLKTEGVDARVINALIEYWDDPALKQFYFQRMNPETEKAFYDMVAFYGNKRVKEEFVGKRLEILKQREAIEAAKKQIFPHGPLAEARRVYATYLIKQGLTAEQADSTWRIVLTWVDANILAYPSGRSIYEVEPKGFGPYMLLVYPIRRVVRFLMLCGAIPARYYDLSYVRNTPGSSGKPSADAS